MTPGKLGLPLVLFVSDSANVELSCHFINRPYIDSLGSHTPPKKKNILCPGKFFGARGCYAEVRIEAITAEAVLGTITNREC